MIYSYQQPTYNALRRTFHRHERSLLVDMPVKLRNHTLLIGPTGTGKTHLVDQVASELNWDVFHINVSSWIILGARETPTWNGLQQWLSEIQPGRPAVVVLDELDKIWGEDSWTRYLRAELFSLMDGRRMPMNGFSLDVEDEESVADAANRTDSNFKNLLIVGCGAFQGVFDQKPGMGFRSEMELTKGAAHLSKNLQPELVNRFSQEILSLPVLTRHDYEEMISQIIPLLYSDLAAEVARIAPSRIERALGDKASARFAENLVSEAFDNILLDEPTPWVKPVKSEG